MKGKSMFKEFKNFIARGNVMDMAVGIIMGAAFTAIVTSMVGDLLMPIVGMVTSGVDFADKLIALNGESYVNLAAAKEAGAPVVTYGVFINAVINFLIVAFVVFMLVRYVNKIKDAAIKEEKAVKAAAPAAPSADIVLLTEIRDLLKK
jgi:large conductance mechanosensitive channel